jgi:hypothetical protein
MLCKSEWHSLYKEFVQVAEAIRRRGDTVQIKMISTIFVGIADVCLRMSEKTD